MAVNFACTLKHTGLRIHSRQKGTVVMVMVRVAVLLVIDYIYDVTSTNHEFQTNDNILPTLILASSYISEDTQNCREQWTVANIYPCHNHELFYSWGITPFLLLEIAINCKYLEPRCHIGNEIRYYQKLKFYCDINIFCYTNLSPK